MKRALTMVRTLFFMATLVVAVNAQSAPTTGSQGSPTAVSSADKVFAPFVNRLRVAVKEPQIRVTWQDIASFSGTYLIYRSTAEITTANIAAATLVGEVSQGDEYYTDVPANSGSYYYAILAKERSGNVYRVFIPFRNKTMSPISISVVATAKDLASSVTDLDAHVSGSAIEVGMTNSRTTRTLAIFRSTKQILSRDDVDSSTQIYSSSGKNISHLDYALPGVPYYYAAVDLDAFQQNAYTLVAGQNTLARPVTIPLGANVSLPSGTKRSARIMPLPTLTLPDLGSDDSQISIEGTNPTRITVALDSITRSRLDALTAGLSTGQASRKSQDLLPSDRLQIEGKMSSPPIGEYKVLLDILSGTFLKTNYDESARQLGALLSLPLSKELDAKAHYYLGQSYYLTQRYKEALLEFLYVQDELNEFAQPWIDNTLELSAAW